MWQMLYQADPDFTSRVVIYGLGPTGMALSQIPSHLPMADTWVINILVGAIAFAVVVRSILDIVRVVTKLCRGAGKDK